MNELMTTACYFDSAKPVFLIEENSVDCRIRILAWRRYLNRNTEYIYTSLDRSIGTNFGNF
jgi:hypothetical protein